MTKVLALLTALILLGTPAAVANSCYGARLVSVYDGDTVVADVHLGLDIVLSAQRIRFLGIDAPEIRTLATREAATAARDALAAKIGGERFRICTAGRERDSFGRILARAYAGGSDLSRWMLEQGHAVEYRE